jgi:hypothetical protein
MEIIRGLNVCIDIVSGEDHISPADTCNVP